MNENKDLIVLLHIYPQKLFAEMIVKYNYVI